MKKFKSIIILFVTISSLIFIIFSYLEYLQHKQNHLKTITFEKEVAKIKNSFTNMVLQKQKATMGIAISLSADKVLVGEIEKRDIDNSKYTKIIKKYKDYTLYQNIWIQILDNRGYSIYRSWDSLRGDNLLKVRPEIKTIISNKKCMTTISVGKYDLSIKAIVPIKKKGVFIGEIEVISHFNSISKIMKKIDIDSVIVLKEKYKKQLKYPFTGIFIKDKYYIANFDAPKKYMDYLVSNGIENYFIDGYMVENDYLIVSCPIRDTNNEILGYAIMFEKLSIISTIESEFFVFQWVSSFIILLLFIIGILVINLLVKNKKQKAYYKDILNSTTNIIVVNDKCEMIDVNEVFFKYFNQFLNLDDFKKHHDCICDFFVKEDGYIEEEVDGVLWTDYLLESKESVKHKAKIKIDNKIYYFFVDVSFIKPQKDKKVIVFSDITSEEEYLTLSLTDELTQIGNRRFFNNKIESEISRANRYNSKLSLIFFDIDFFKKINDENGHDVGDKILSTYSKAMQKELRSEDIFCRVGGEEFAIILPLMDKENAKYLAEKLRLFVQNFKLIVPITMSFGVVEYESKESSEMFYKRADCALYEAKNSGRNIVVTG